MNTIEIHELNATTHPELFARLDVMNEDKPAQLWARGDLAVLTAQVSALVHLTGARASTGYGEHLGMEIAAGLANAQHTILTDSAYGISSAVLRSVLAVERTPVVVMAAGVDVGYPYGNAALLDSVIERGGLILSAEEPEKQPTRRSFASRDRLIAALSDVVVVVEASGRSGRANVAAHATQYGRKLGAVPGPVTSVNSALPHHLISEGLAQLVTSAEDVAALAQAIS